MPELDRFEARFAAAYRRYLDEVPTEVDAGSVARAAAAQPRARGLARPWSLRPMPALAWLLILGILLAALGASAVFVASQRPALGLACPAGTNPGAPGPAAQARPALGLGQSVARSVNPVYDRDSRKIVVLDETATWMFDVCTNTWTRLDDAPGGQFQDPYPITHLEVRLVYDESADLVIGVSQIGETWAYDVEANRWTERSAAPLTWGYPGWLRLAYLRDPGRVLALVGPWVTEPGASSGALWTYDARGDRWEHGPEDTGLPDSTLARVGRFIAYDTSARRVVSYVDGCADCADGDETWLLDPATGAWSRASGATPKVYRDFREEDGEIAFDESARKIVIYGLGVGGIGEDWGAMVGFDATAYSWQTLWTTASTPSEPTVATTIDPGPRMHHWLVYDAANERILLMGGERQAEGNEGTGGWVPADDIWAFDAGARTWTRLLAASTP